MKKWLALLLTVGSVLCLASCGECTHDFVESKHVDSTCAAQGYVVYRCSLCDEEKTESLPLVQHAFDEGEVTKEATCTEEGVKTFTCQNCQETKTEVIAKKEHAYDNGKVTQAATCDKEGTKTFTCADCKGTKIESIAKKKHTLDKGKVTKEATCTAEGTKSFSCTKCDYVKTEAIAKKSHNYDSGKVTKAATCDKEGVKTFTCADCKGTKTEAIAKKSHSYDSGKVTKAATCTKEGVKTYTCTGCKATKTEKIKKTSHQYGAANCQQPKVCKICGAKSGSVGAHNFVKGKCTVCSAVDKNSDEYKYEMLKKKADGIAFACAETVVRNMLKNPSSMQVLSQSVRDEDEYFRYYIHMRYSATNSYGGTVTDDAYVLVRVSPKMDGTFHYTYNTVIGINYLILDSMKTEWGWGTKPSDWSLDAAQQYVNPVEVSVKQILAYPQKYVGQYVKIKEELVISSNYLQNKKFYVYQSTGDGKYDYNVSNSLEVFYRFCDNVDELIMVDGDYQKITVYGVVKQYSNSTEAYIDAYEIIIE